MYVLMTKFCSNSIIYLLVLYSENCEIKTYILVTLHILLAIFTEITHPYNILKQYNKGM